MTEDSKKRVNRTPKNKQPRKTGLRDLLSPSYEEARAGIRGITLEQEVVSVEELKARKRRRTAIMGVATIIFLVTGLVLSSLLIARLDPFKKRDLAGDGNGTAVTFVIEQGETPQQIAGEQAAQTSLALGSVGLVLALFWVTSVIPLGLGIWGAVKGSQASRAGVPAGGGLATSWIALSLGAIETLFFFIPMVAFVIAAIASTR